MKIGQVAECTGVSPDTLRYYERIGMLRNVPRTAAGIRDYDQRCVSQVRFVRRAQAMGFSLQEIGRLLEFRADPQAARLQVRRLAADKLEAIENQLADIRTLRDELQLLLNLCAASDDCCPILERME